MIDKCKLIIYLIFIVFTLKSQTCTESIESIGNISTESKLFVFGETHHKKGNLELRMKAIKGLIPFGLNTIFIEYSLPSGILINEYAHGRIDSLPITYLDWERDFADSLKNLVSIHEGKTIRIVGIDVGMSKFRNVIDLIMKSPDMPDSFLKYFEAYKRHKEFGAVSIDSAISKLKFGLIKSEENFFYRSDLERLVNYFAGAGKLTKRWRSYKEYRSEFDAREEYMYEHMLYWFEKDSGCVAFSQLGATHATKYRSRLWSELENWESCVSMLAKNPLINDRVFTALILYKQFYFGKFKKMESYGVPKKYFKCWIKSNKDIFFLIKNKNYPESFGEVKNQFDGVIFNNLK